MTARLAKSAGRTLAAVAIALLLATVPAQAQDAVTARPALSAQQIQTCLGGDIENCPLDDRLALIRNISGEIDRLAGQVGLLCELNPGNCPAMDTVNQMHAQYRAMDQLIWGLPQYRIDQTPNQERIGAVLPQADTGAGAMRPGPNPFQ